MLMNQHVPVVLCTREELNITKACDQLKAQRAPNETTWRRLPVYQHYQRPLNTKTRYIREGALGTSRLVVNQPSWYTDPCKRSNGNKDYIRSHLPVYFFCSVNLALSFSNKTILVTMEESV